MWFGEVFLQFIWQFNLLQRRELTGENGEQIRVISPGLPNSHAGPDFLQAKLLINQVLWVGNVEIHLRSSDWLQHQHQFDQSYDSVILHVVYEHNAAICRTDGSIIPVLVLKGLFDESLLLRYEQLLASVKRLPCENYLAKVDAFNIQYFLGRVAIERFLQKTDEVYEMLESLKGNWEEVFYRYLGKSFGFKLNAGPMEMLTSSLPAAILARHKDSPLRVEALLFGQAGFLGQDFADNYPLLLKQEYQFLRKKYRLQPIPVSVWKFMKLRPQNFPTLRLAQFAALMLRSEHLFAMVLAEKNPRNLINLFRFLPVNNYWLNHFHFQKNTHSVKLQLGENSINGLIMNVVSLFLFAYGKYTDQYELVERAIALQESLPPEDNAVVRLFNATGFKPASAGQSQALLQLWHSYCSKKRCLNCDIGYQLLKKG